MGRACCSLAETTQETVCAKTGTTNNNSSSGSSSTFSIDNTVPRFESKWGNSLSSGSSQEPGNASKLDRKAETERTHGSSQTTRQEGGLRLNTNRLPDLTQLNFIRLFLYFSHQYAIIPPFGCNQSIILTHTHTQILEVRSHPNKLRFFSVCGENIILLN